jgi:hypothetical protein
MSARFFARKKSRARITGGILPCDVAGEAA